jgi:hypothetical protein
LLAFYSGILKYLKNRVYPGVYRKRVHTEMSVERMMGLGMTALKSNFRTLKKPYKLNFAVTYWCQSRCLTCNIWQMKPKGELNIDEIRSFASKNPVLQMDRATGGEVFMRSDLVEIARAFSESSKHLYILTNAY